MHLHAQTNIHASRALGTQCSSHHIRHRRGRGGGGNPGIVAAAAHSSIHSQQHSQQQPRVTRHGIMFTNLSAVATAGVPTAAAETKCTDLHGNASERGSVALQLRPLFPPTFELQPPSPINGRDRHGISRSAAKCFIAGAH